MPTLRNQNKSRPVTRQKDQKVISPRAPEKKGKKQLENKTRPTTRRTRAQAKELVRETEIQGDEDQTPRTLTKEVQHEHDVINSRPSEQTRETEIQSDDDQTFRTLTNEVQQEHNVLQSRHSEQATSLPEEIRIQTTSESEIQTTGDQTPNTLADEVQYEHDVLQSRPSEQATSLPEENRNQTSSEPESQIDNCRPDLVLGQLDAHFTKMFIDVGMKSSHKYCSPPDDFFKLVQNPKVRPLSEQLMQSYASSFEYVKYQEIDGYFSDQKEICVKARKNFPKMWTITGLDGYLADVPCGVEVPEFSLFGSNRNGKEKIMLGPASFVNHACTPNARFICGGETRGKTIVRIETLRHINADEEIFVKYSEDYFGPNNIDCRCSACLEKLFAPPLHEVGSSSISDMPASESQPAADEGSNTLRPGSPTLFEAPDESDGRQHENETCSSSASDAPHLEMPDEFDGESGGYTIPHASEIKRPQPQTSRSKKVKYDEIMECLICEVKCKRMDKHLLSSHPELSKEEVRTLKVKKLIFSMLNKMFFDFSRHLKNTSILF